MKKIVFFGSGYFVIPVIEKLKDTGLKLVITHESKGRLINYLKKHNIPYISSDLKDSLVISKIQDLKPDIGVLASFGAFIPQEVIDLFPLGILNIHPSLLPKLKGPSPIQYTILSGNTTAGITVIKLDDQIDHGPIAIQKEVHLNGSETLESLTELMFYEGAALIKELVQKMENGQKIEYKVQRHENESWSKKIEKDDGKIELSQPPKLDELERTIRAFYPWPGVYLTASLSGKEKIIKLLPQRMLQVEGKKPMNVKDFINGYGKDAIHILTQLSYVT